MPTRAPLLDGRLTHRQGRRGRARDDRGQALVEFAFASIVFFMMLFGIIEFGIAVWQYNMVADLAQEGARWGAVRGGTSTTTPAGSYANLQSFVASRAPGMTVTVDPTFPEPSTLAPGDTVTVVVRSTFTPLAGLLPQTALTLQSTARMIVVR
jgi:Flp pilus assembly protein TadG